MSVRRRAPGGLSVAGVAIALGLHAVVAGLAIVPGSVSTGTTDPADSVLLADLLPANPGRLAAALAHAQVSGRAGRPPAVRAASPAHPTDPRAHDATEPASDERIALEPGRETARRDDVPPAPPTHADSDRQPSAPTNTAVGAEAPTPESATEDVAVLRKADEGPSVAGATDDGAVGGPTPALAKVEDPATVISESERALLEDVAARAAVSTRAEVDPFPARRAVFEFLLDHPDFATHVVRALKLGRYRIWKTGDGLFLDDGWGSTGQLAVLYRAEGRRIMYARGQYDARLLPQIRGEAVVVIEYGFRPATDGHDLVSTAITSYVSLDSRALAVMARLASGAATRKADLETRKLVRSFARVSQAIDENPAAVVAQLRQRPDVPTRELEEFASLLGLR